MMRDLAEIFRYHSSLIDPPSRPWLLDRWAWATQGHVLVGRRDDVGVACDATPVARLKARRYLDDIPDDLAPVPLAALRAFAGPQTDRAECERCHGSGYEYGDEIKCEHCGRFTRRECGQCGGDGRAGMPMREGRIAGVPLNLELLAYALTFVPQDETASLGTIPSQRPEAGRALLVIGRSWRIAVMAIREPVYDVPIFPLCASSAQQDAVSPLTTGS